MSVFLWCANTKNLSWNIKSHKNNFFSIYWEKIDLILKTKKSENFCKSHFFMFFCVATEIFLGKLYVHQKKLSKKKNF
jgi:hypothetical protein